MSIKIYDGHRFVPSETIPVAELFNTTRKALDPVRDTLDMTALAETAAFAFDRTYRHNPDQADGQDFLAEAWEKMTEEADKGYNLSNSFSMRVGANLYDPEDHYIYVAVSASHNTLTKTFENTHPYLQEYGYWNSSDRPEHLTEEDWAERRSNWDWLISQPDPNLVTEHWTLRSTSHPDPSLAAKPDQIVRYQPSIHRRARRLALDDRTQGCNFEEAVRVISQSLDDPNLSIETHKHAAQLERLTTANLTGKTKAAV